MRNPEKTTCAYAEKTLKKKQQGYSTIEPLIQTDNKLTMDHEFGLHQDFAQWKVWTHEPPDLNRPQQHLVEPLIFQRRQHEVFDTIAKFVSQFKCRGPRCWVSLKEVVILEEVEVAVLLCCCDWLWWDLFRRKVWSDGNGTMSWP